MRSQTFFENKVTSLVIDAEVDNYILPKIVGVSPTDNAVYFSETDIKHAIDDLKRSRAQGHDEIPGCVVKDLKDIVAMPLCWLFNIIIITTGCIPKAWKISKIIPVFKKGNRSKIENYQPISNNSSLSKVFEKCLIKKLFNTLSHDSLMGTFQHSFRPGCSTTTAGVALHDFIASSLDSGKKVITYSTDWTAAFDLLRPNLLVKRMLELNVPHHLVNVILNFLSNRSSYVNINDSNSYVTGVPYGCVQGSVLGPVLFNIYVSRLAEIITESIPSAHVTAYADDCYIAISSNPSDLNNTLSNVQNLLIKQIEWLKMIGMSPNLGKTELVVFGHSSECVLRISDTPLTSKNTIKVLGVKFEKNLKWGYHANYIIKKAGSQTYSLRLLNKVLPRHLFKQVIFAHFVSHITYASPIWAGNLNTQDVRRFETLLNKALRLYCRDHNRTLSNFQLHESSNIRTFKGLVTLNDAIFLHSICSTSNTPLALRLFEQSFTNDRFPERINFCDFSSKRIGRSSFINRSKSISETIPFQWPDLPRVKFKMKMKRAIGPTFGL